MFSSHREVPGPARTATTKPTRLVDASRNEGLPERAEGRQDAIEQHVPHLALVEIETTPPGATISPDVGILVRSARRPKSLALRPGATKILLIAKGYRSVELCAELRTRSAGPAFRLFSNRIYGDIELRAPSNQRRSKARFPRRPSSSAVERAWSRSCWPPGLFVSAPGFQTARLFVTALPDVRVPVGRRPVAAEAEAGTWRRANITGALVRIDGKEAGFRAGGFIEGVPRGMRQVEILEESRPSLPRHGGRSEGERAFVDGLPGTRPTRKSSRHEVPVASKLRPGLHQHCDRRRNCSGRLTPPG